MLFSIGGTLGCLRREGDAGLNPAGRFTPFYPDAVPGTRAYFTAKDVEVAQAANYGLMIWNSKNAGTLSNVSELAKARKKSVVFVNRASSPGFPLPDTW
ncbi:MAG: hypothetical protein ABIS51_10370 [Sphingomonas sp.]